MPTVRDSQQGSFPLCWRGQPCAEGLQQITANGGCWCSWEQKRGDKGACAALCCCLPMGISHGKGCSGVSVQMGSEREWRALSHTYPSLCLALFWGFILLIPIWIPVRHCALGCPPQCWLWHCLWQLCGVCTRPCPGCPGSNHPIDYHFDSCCFIYLLSNNLLNKTLLEQLESAQPF